MLTVRERFLKLIENGQLKEAQVIVVEKGCVVTGYYDQCTNEAIAACRDLALIAYEQRELFRAIALYNAAIQMLVVCGASESMEATICRSNLARCHIDLGDLVTAENLITAVLETIPALGLSNDPGHAVALSNLGRVKWLQNSLEEAEAAFVRSIVVRATIWGRKHPCFATGLVQLASLYLEIKLLSRARFLVDKAKQLFESANRCEHLDYAITLRLLGDIEKASGESSQAIRHYGKALDVVTRVRGEVSKLVDSFAMRLSEIQVQKTKRCQEPLF